jgi:hypothetical protein
MATAPALLLMGLSAALRGAPAPQALQPVVDTSLVDTLQGSSMLRDGVLSPSQTMVVAAHQSSGAVLLRGRLQPAVEVAGKAPLSGQVSRVMVEPGEFVQVNDRVLQLSSGASSRPAPRVERLQTSAERAQVAAAQAQETLQQRMLSAQQRLVAAQQRVDRARKRVEEAQSAIAKLQRGEVPLATPSEEPSEPDVSTREAPQERARPQGQSAAVRAANRDALQDAQNEERSALRSLERASQKAAAAHRALTEAEQDVRTKTQKLLDARATAAQNTPKPTPDDGSAGESSGTAAKAAVSEAENEATAARARAQTARNEAAAADRAVAAARTAARQSAEKARLLRNLQDLPLFADNDDSRPDRSRERSRSRRDGSGRSARRQQAAPTASSVTSVEDAVRLVQSAMDESNAAVADARRIKQEVQRYERQVRRTEEELNETGKGLEAAQQRVLDATIQANLSVVRAPASGVVLWVAPIADEVSSGETIITIGRREVLQARLVDHSGAWKNIKRDDMLSAVVQVADKPVSNGGAASAAASGDATTASGVVAADAVPVMVRVREVIEPARPGEPAVLRVAVFNPRRNGGAGAVRRRFRPGMALLCSVDKPGDRSTISVPNAAVLRDVNSERGVVAVLAPVAPDGSAGSDGAHRIEWRPVTLGESNGVQQEIASGLSSGDRIALQPQALRAFVNAYGPQATVRLG